MRRLGRAGPHPGQHGGREADVTLIAACPRTEPPSREAPSCLGPRGRAHSDQAWQGEAASLTHGGHGGRAVSPRSRRGAGDATCPVGTVSSRHPRTIATPPVELLDSPLRAGRGPGKAESSLSPSLPPSPQQSLAFFPLSFSAPAVHTYFVGGMTHKVLPAIEGERCLVDPDSGLTIALQQETPIRTGARESHSGVQGCTHTCTSFWREYIPVPDLADFPAAVRTEAILVCFPHTVTDLSCCAQTSDDTALS